MKSIKFTLSFIAIFLFLSSIHEILNFECGADNLKLKPINLDFNKEINHKTSEKLTAQAYTPIKIGMDYTSLKKPSSMSESTFNIIKNEIDETAKAFGKFVKIQHTDIDLSQVGDKIKEGCDLNELGSDYKNFLINNDVIIFPSFSSSLGQNVLAAAGYCLTYRVESNKYRPVAGVLLINDTLSFEKQNTKEYLKNLLLHEMTHILIFSPQLMENWGLIGKKNSISYVTSNNVVIKARQHFNCATITGIPLENQGGQGSAGSHWEARYMLGDYMISTNYIDNTISDITIALFEDSGIYDVEYYSGGLFKFGKNRGCSFLNNKCITNGKPLTEEFCITAQPMCSQSRTSKASCAIYKYKNPVPSEYQYFSDPNLGGFLPVNYCPVANDQDSDTTYNPSNCKIGTSALEADFGENFGDKSFCFLSSLLPSSSSLNTTYQSICYEVKCNPSSKTITVKVGSSTVTCPTNGGNINNPSGFKGYINCPKYYDICDAEDNEVCNDMFDCLSKEVEAEDDSYEYDRKNQDFTRVSGNNNGNGYGNGNGYTRPRSSGENIKMNYILFLGYLLLLLL